MTVKEFKEALIYKGREQESRDVNTILEDGMWMDKWYAP